MIACYMQGYYLHYFVIYDLNINNLVITFPSGYGPTLPLRSPEHGMGLGDKLGQGGNR
jgi:hypothetical protein